MCIVLKVPGFEIKLEKAVREINENNYKRVFLQVPEGLKRFVSDFIDFLEGKTEAIVLVSGDPCFGACDVGSYEIKDLGVDLVVQIGHTPIPNLGDLLIPVLFINAVADVDVLKVVEKAIPSFKGESIGLVTTAQHVHKLDMVSKFLENKGFQVSVGYGFSRISFKGQILGCNFSAATSIKGDVDMFLYIGGGTFHPLGLLLSTDKPVIACDPYTKKVMVNELEELKDIVLRQRYGAIARCRDAKVFGVLVGIKKGQQRMDLALNVCDKLKQKNLKYFIIALNDFNPGNIESFRDLDCVVSVGCPRIAIDDYLRYEIPIITPIELDIVLGYEKWENYRFDEIS